MNGEKPTTNTPPENTNEWDDLMPENAFMLGDYENADAWQTSPEPAPAGPAETPTPEPAPAETPAPVESAEQSSNSPKDIANMTPEEKAEWLAMVKAELARRALNPVESPAEAPEETPEEPLDATPLTAINADFTHDRKELAHDYAEQALNAELETAKGLKGLVKRVWKGNLFKKYYEKKYEGEILSGARKTSEKSAETGENLTLDEVVENRSESAISRFTLAATEEYEKLIHAEAGEKLSEADEETTAKVKSAIEWFASAEIPEGGNLTDLKVEFENRLGREKAEASDKKRPLNDKLIDNYYTIAIEARKRAEHGVAMERVMEGFKVYNAEVRNNIRTAAHKDAIDKITSAVEGKLSIIPPEFVAAAVGTAYSLTQSGARALAGAGLGIGVSGLFAGLRERNRVTEDRARFARDRAVGLRGEPEGGEGGEQPEGEEHPGSEAEKSRLAKKREKYEAKIGGTLYDIQPAADLTAALEEALKARGEENNEKTSKALLAAIARARVRVDFSDSESKDLISYSSADKIGDERLALDLALIRAEKSLSEEDKTNLGALKATVYKYITESVKSQDEKFKDERAKLALKASAKTVGLGAAFFFGSQELIAAISPAKIGLFEKAGLLKTTNNNDAEETVLANVFSGSRGTYEITRLTDPAEKTHLEENGFELVEKRPAYDELKQELVEMRPEEAVSQKFKYDGWTNDSTTKGTVYLNNGQFQSALHGETTIGLGSSARSISYDDFAAAGKMKGYITIGNAKFEVVSSINDKGQLTWGENGIFTTPTGETFRAIGENGEKLYKYFEVAIDNGTDADGFTHIIPFGTDVGRDSFSDTISKVTETIVHHEAEYEAVKQFIEVANPPIETTETMVRDLFTSGAVITPVTSRVGLGASTPENSEPAPEVPTLAEVISTVSAPEAPVASEAPVSEQSTEPAEPEQPEQPTEQKLDFSSLHEALDNTRREEAAITPETGDTKAAARERLIQYFGSNYNNTLQSLGVRLITSDENPSAEYSDMLSKWWSTLSDDVKTEVRAYAEQDDPNSRYGAAFRAWLALNPEK